MRPAIGGLISNLLRGSTMPVDGISALIVPSVTFTALYSSPLLPAQPTIINPNIKIKNPSNDFFIVYTLHKFYATLPLPNRQIVYWLTGFSVFGKKYFQCDTIHHK